MKIYFIYEKYESDNIIFINDINIHILILSKYYNIIILTFYSSLS